MEADLGGFVRPDVNLPRQASGVTLQAAVRNVQGQVPGRERPSGRIGGDGGGCELPPRSRRACNGANELGSVLVAPEVRDVPGPRGRRARQYRDYVETAVRKGLAKSPWESVQEQGVLGGGEFLASLRNWIGGDEKRI